MKRPQRYAKMKITAVMRQIDLEGDLEDKVDGGEESKGRIKSKYKGGKGEARTRTKQRGEK